MSPEGFEPPTPALKGRCYYQLSYEPVIFKNAVERDRTSIGLLPLPSHSSASASFRHDRDKRDVLAIPKCQRTELGGREKS